ncbi:MAG: thiamine diphosphokinase [Ruminiclostridium sp.]
MEKKSCFIFGAGERTLLPLLPPKGSVVIAADGGLGFLRDAGISPDFIIGDFDSLGEIPTGDKVTVLPKEKDVTDMWAAAEKGIDRGCNSFVIYGGTGGRLDHTLANLQLIAHLSRLGFEARLFGSGYVISAVTKGEIEVSGKAGAYVSVFSLSDLCEGVTIENLKYTVENCCLTNDFPLGVSNEFTGKTAKISVKSGTIAVYYTI